jgi:hypothetical protein
MELGSQPEAWLPGRIAAITQILHRRTMEQARDQLTVMQIDRGNPSDPNDLAFTVRVERTSETTLILWHAGRAQPVKNHHGTEPENQ